MSMYEKLKTALVDIYKSRGISNVVFFHCDHWEPWRSLPGQNAICSQNGDEIERFVYEMNRIDFARKLTLFYKNNINHSVNPVEPPKNGVQVHPDDNVFFSPKPPTQSEVARKAMGTLIRSSSHEIQVHIHHENVTYNHHHKALNAVQFFERPECRIHEEERLSLAVRLSLEAIREETGLPMNRWFFVHGHWALNASDPDTCHVVREIEILMRHGCLGDFTFPAGRPQVNPRLEVPHFVRPVAKPKGYDLPEAEPELAYGNAEAAKNGKFFIWSSKIKHVGASVDYYASWYRKRLDEMNELAKEIVSTSYAAGGTLYIKSHAHSMHPSYYEDTRIAIFPFQHPGVQALMSIIFDAAGRAGANVEFLGAGEVYDRFCAAQMPAGTERNLDIPFEPLNLSMIEPSPPPAIRLVEPLPASAAPEPERGVVAALPVAAAPVAGTVAIAAAPVAAAAAPVAPAPVAPPPPPPPAPPRENLLGTLKASAPPPVKKQETKIDVVDSVMINSDAMDVLRMRVSNLGDAQSGASSFYINRMAKGALLVNYEIELVRHLINQPERFASYHEVGCGVGVLAMLLAAKGLPAVGIESDRKRYDAAEAILETVRRRHLEMMGKDIDCRFMLGVFPDVMAGQDVSNSVALFTNVSKTLTEPQRADLVAALRRYKGVVIDVFRFLSSRPTAPEQDALIDELVKAGLSNPRPAFQGSSWRFVRFDGQG